MNSKGLLFSYKLLRPKRLSRGFSNIVVAVIYHPPTADNSYTTMRDHLKNSLECVEADYPHSAVILAGDFNKLDFRIPAKCFQLKPTVNFPTRGANILDQVFTNLKNYYTQPVRGPPFGLSDHVTITIFLEARSRTEVVYHLHQKPIWFQTVQMERKNVDWKIPFGARAFHFP